MNDLTPLHLTYPDVAILCMKSDEYMAILEEVRMHKPVTEHSRTTFSFVVYDKQDEATVELSCLVIFGGHRQGHIAASALMYECLYMVRPRAVIIVGMLASLKPTEVEGNVYFIGKASIGDLGLVTASGTFFWDANVVEVDRDQVMMASQISKTFVEDREAKKIEFDLSITSGISANQVKEGALQAFPEDLKSTLAYEMEVAAFYATIGAFNASQPETRKVKLLGAYKAVSDHGTAAGRSDPLEKRKKQLRATKNAALCALRHIEFYNKDCKFKASEKEARRLAQMLAWLDKNDRYSDVRNRVQKSLSTSQNIFIFGNQQLTLIPEGSSEPQVTVAVKPQLQLHGNSSSEKGADQHF